MIERATIEFGRSGIAALHAAVQLVGNETQISTLLQKGPLM